MKLGKMTVFCWLVISTGSRSHFVERILTPVIFFVFFFFQVKLADYAHPALTSRLAEVMRDNKTAAQPNRPNCFSPTIQHVYKRHRENPDPLYRVYDLPTCPDVANMFSANHIDPSAYADRGFENNCW